MTGWHRKYWDTIEQLYWSPEKLGLRSISRKAWGDDPEKIVLERTMVRTNAALYTRPETAAANLARMRRLEENLNHIFDITFGIAACAVISRMFCRPFGFTDDGPFLRIGREAKMRYPLLSGNSTQQDGFFVSQRSAIGVELKLDSATSPGQVLKYLALMVGEELLTGKREQTGLLFVTPNSGPKETFLSAKLSPTGRLPAGFIASVPSTQRNRYVDAMLDKHGNHFDDLSSRTTFVHLSWRQVYDEALSIGNDASEISPPNETLLRLMSGFAEAISEHEGTNV